MLAMGSIEFMMFWSVPGLFVVWIAFWIFVNTSNSDFAVKAREKIELNRELNKYTEYEDDDRNYELEREQLQYFRNETFDRQQGKGQYKNHWE